MCRASSLAAWNSSEIVRLVLLGSTGGFARIPCGRWSAPPKPKNSWLTRKTANRSRSTHRVLPGRLTTTPDRTSWKFGRRAKVRGTSRPCRRPRTRLIPLPAPWRQGTTSGECSMSVPTERPTALRGFDGSICRPVCHNWRCRMCRSSSSGWLPCGREAHIHQRRWV